MNQHVAVIGQDPFGLGIAFDTGRQLAGLLFELHRDFIANGLNLPLVGAGADDKEVRKRGNAGEVENLDVGRLLGFGGADGDEPGGGWGLSGCFLSQNTLLFVSYYIAAAGL